MQVQEKHDRPLYFTGYIGSMEITRIQVNPGSALSIMPRRVMEHLFIPAHRLSATDTNIFRFNANSTRPLGKIKLRCQIGDLKTEVTVYVIDADTSYNLLLGRPWIHTNHIVPSILHQVVKYVDAQGRVHTLVAKRHPFKGVETHFTDSLLYQEVNETTAQGGVASESGNEADDKSESTTEAEDQEWELDLSVIGHDNLNYLMEHDYDKEEWYLEDIQASITDEETGGWYINKNFDLDFLYERMFTLS